MITQDIRELNKRIKSVNEKGGLHREMFSTDNLIDFYDRLSTIDQQEADSIIVLVLLEWND